MAYQNVGTPRFYINILEWLHSVGGLTNDTNLDMALTSPISPITRSSTYDWDGSNNCISFPGVITPVASLIGTKGFVAHLGHNYASCELSVQADQGGPDHYSVGFTENVINSTQYAGGRITCDYDGFSIYKADYSGQLDNPQLNPRLRYDYIGDGDAYNGVDVKVGSIMLGRYYDMQHSPDLNLTMSREYGGIKTIETKGGASLSNAFYTKPPKWGSLGAWELGAGNPALSRSGRRVWDLSFSYLADSDVFPMLSSLNPYESVSDIGAIYSSAYTDFGEDEMEGTEDDIEVAETSWHDDNTLLDSDNFFSQVIHKTNGGQLPFIFQPDGGRGVAGQGNFNPDQFAICKFDQNSFSFQQTAPGLYSAKMKIREVW